MIKCCDLFNRLKTNKAIEKKTKVLYNIIKEFWKGKFTMLNGYFDLPTITFFTQKNIWTGSLYTNFSYRITPINKPAEDDKPAVKELFTQVWYGTQCYNNVKEFVCEFHEDMTAEGLEKTREHLTGAVEEFKKIRKTIEPDFKLH